MSEAKFKVLPRTKDSAAFNETLRLSTHGVKGNLKCFTGEQGEFWVSIIPSLNVTGYGDNEDEAIEDLKYNIAVLCEDLFDANEFERKSELSKLGWIANKFFNKRFSKSYVDENGTLQNFDYPEKVKKSILETA